MPKQKAFELLKFLERFNTEEACRKYLEGVIWNHKPKCPTCHTHNIYRYKSRPVYRCKQCDKQFRVTTGTIFENSKIPLTKWFLAIRYMACTKKGISSIQLAKELGITQKSAWLMEHRIRIALGNNDYSYLLSGIIEVDETYIGGRVRGGKRGRGTTKAKVFGILERETGTLRIMTVKNVDSYTLHPIIYDNVEIGSFIMSDEWRAYNGLDEDFGRAVIKHKKRHYADGEIHVNTLEGTWGHLKRTFKSTYHRPSKKYMDMYLGEFEFRYNNRHKSIQLLFKQAVKQSKVSTSHKSIRRETGAL